MQAAIALLGAVAAGAVTWFLNQQADGQRDRERFVERREALLQKMVANDNHMKLLQFQGTWLLREIRDADQENLMWDDEKLEAAKMVSSLQIFLEQSLPKLMTRPYTASDIGSWTFSPESDMKLQEANRFESKYTGMAELRGFEISLKTGDQLLEAAPPAPAASTR